MSTTLVTGSRGSARMYGHLDHCSSSCMRSDGVGAGCSGLYMDRKQHS